MQSTDIYEGFNAKIENAIEESSVEHKKRLLEDGLMSQQDISINVRENNKSKTANCDRAKYNINCYLLLLII